MRLCLLSFCLLFSLTLQAQVIFEDDFENVPNDWNLGDGNLPTPPGQTGIWEHIPSQKKSWQDFCTSGDLPADAAGDYIMYLADNGGIGGGKALRWVTKAGCYYDSYPGAMKWVLYPWINEADDVYFGFHLKMDAEWKKTGGGNTKFPIWLALGTSWKSGRVWFHMNNSRMFPSSQIRFYHALATPSFQVTNMFYETIGDGDWHWLEFRYKRNSNVNASDGSLTTWLDGVETSHYDGLKFWDDSVYGSGQRLHSVWLLLGNGKADTGDWVNQDWAGFNIDNFKGALSYIGPPNLEPPELDTLAPSSLNVEYFGPPAPPVILPGPQGLSIELVEQ